MSVLANLAHELEYKATDLDRQLAQLPTELELPVPELHLPGEESGVLPDELLSLFGSSKEIPEIYSDGPFFNFYSERATTGHDGSRIVCERYGLLVARSFILHLWRGRGADLTSMDCAMYMLGGLVLLSEDEELISSYLASMDNASELELCLLNLCQLVYSLLSEQDNREPVMSEPLRQLTDEPILPTEVLALIFRSKRINRATSASFCSVRERRRMREGELSNRAIYGCVSCVDQRYFICGGDVSAVISEDNETVKLVSSSRALVDMNRAVWENRSGGGVTLVCSWRDYARLTKRLESSALLELTPQLDLTDLVTVVIWMLLLSKPPKRGKERSQSAQSSILSVGMELTRSTLLSSGGCTEK